MNAIKKSTQRFLRIMISALITTIIKTTIENLTELNIPQALHPVFVALLCAIGKYLREKYKIDLPF